MAKFGMSFVPLEATPTLHFLISCCYKSRVPFSLDVESPEILILP